MQRDKADAQVKEPSATQAGLEDPIRAFLDTLSTMADLMNVELFEVSASVLQEDVEPPAEVALVAMRHGGDLRGPPDPSMACIIQAVEQARKGAGSNDEPTRRIRWLGDDLACVLEGRDEAATAALDRVTAWVDRHLPVVFDQSRERDALDALGEGLVVVDARGIIARCTRRAAEILGTSPELIEGGRLVEVLPAVPPSLEPNEVARGALGETYPEVGYLVQQLAPTSSGVERVGLLVKLRHEQRFASQRRGYLRFFSALRHDVRSPLTALKGLVSVLMDEPEMPAHERLGLLSLLEQEAERTVTWVEDYLLLLRLRFEPRPTNLVSMPVSAVLTDLVRRFEAHARERRIRLSLELPTTADQTVIRVDSSLLEPFGNNLLGHVLRLGDAGAEVAVSASPETGAIIVRAHGPGLFASHPKEPFMTLARSTAAGKRTPGVGLGLFAVKKIADVHGWQVTADVEAREGGPGELVIVVEWGR